LNISRTRGLCLAKKSHKSDEILKNSTKHYQWLAEGLGGFSLRKIWKKSENAELYLKGLSVRKGP